MWVRGGAGTSSEPFRRAALARRLRAVAAALLFAPVAARAACPGDTAEPPLAAIDADARVAFLRRTLEDARRPAEVWSATWGIVDGGLAVTQLALVPRARTKEGRILLVGGGVSAALGVVQVLGLPVTIPPLPPADADPCAALPRLEAVLARAARNEAIGSGPAAHAGNFVLNALLGLGAGLASRRWGTAALVTAGGIAMGELQILTQPTALIGARERYLRGELGASDRPPAAAAAGLRALPGGAAVAIEVRF